jgi:DNA-binding IclR family transcriptional regulator
VQRTGRLVTLQGIEAEYGLPPSTTRRLLRELNVPVVDLGMRRTWVRRDHFERALQQRTVESR